MKDEAKATGNVAVMHEVLEKFLDFSRRGLAFVTSYRYTEEENEEIEAAFDEAKSALSKPLRNCDRFADELDAQLAFLNEEWLISVDRESMLETDRFENWTDKMRLRYAHWLLATANSTESQDRHVKGDSHDS